MTSTTHDLPSARRGRLRRLGLAAAVGLTLVLGGYLAAALALRAFLEPASLADRLEPRVSAALNRDVRIERAQVALFPRPSVRLTGLRVENPEPFHEVPLASVDELRLLPRLLPLLQRRVEIDGIAVRGPRVLLQVDDEGRTNFGDFVPAREQGRAVETRAPFSLQVRRLEIRDGRVGYRDRRRGRQVQLDAIDASGSVSRTATGELQISATGGGDGFRLMFPPFWRKGVQGMRLGADISARAGPRFGWLEISRGSLSLNDLALGVSGRIDSVTSSRRRLDVEIGAERLPLQDLVRALPDSIRDAFRYSLGGELDLHLRAVGVLGPDARPELTGHLAVRSAGVSSDRGVRLVENGSADAQLETGRLVLTRSRGRVLGGPLEASGELALDSAAAFQATVRMRPSLDVVWTALASTERARRPPPQGQADLDLRLTGRVGDPGRTRATGAVALRDVALSGGRLSSSIQIPEAQIRLDGDRARWSGVAVRLGGDVVRTSGSMAGLFARAPDGRRAPPVVDGTLEAARLDLDALLGPKQEIGYSRLAFARLGGRRIDGRSAEELAAERPLRRPARLPASGEIRFTADSLIHRPYRLAGVSGRLKLSPHRIEVDEVRLRAYSGRASGRGWVDLADAEGPFRLELRLEAGRAAEALAENTPVGRLVEGALTVDLAVDGALDSLLLPVGPRLSGGGLLDFAEGRLTPNPVSGALASFLGRQTGTALAFSRWTLPFTIREGGLHISHGTLGSPDLKLDLGGVVGLGGGLDLRLLAHLDTATARRIAGSGGPAGDIMRSYLGAGTAPQLGLLVRGTTSKPDVAVDRSWLEAATRDVARRELEGRGEAARQDLERRGEAARQELQGREDAARQDLERRGEAARQEVERVRDAAQTEAERRGRDAVQRLLGGARPADSAATADSARRTGSPPGTATDTTIGGSRDGTTQSGSRGSGGG